MAKQPSNTPLIAAVGIALVLLLGANIMAQKNNPEIQERLEKEQEEKKNQEQEKKAQTETPNQPTNARGNDLVAMGPRSLIGDKNASTKIVIGYDWTPAVQGNPGVIFDAIDNLKKMAPNASIEVVNRDANPTASAGISVNGKVIVPLRQDGTINLENGAIQGLMMAVHGNKP